MDSHTAPHDLPQTILRLPCYEPAGSEIALTGEALTRNTLLTGAIGSGKTSTLNRMLSQLIAYRADEADAKIGLLIFDFKDDGTAERVRSWARAAGRLGDVEELSAKSPSRLELFEGFQSMAQLEETTESMLTALPPETGENSYFEAARRKRLECALGIYRLVKSGTLYGPEVLSFIDAYISSGSGHGIKVEPPEEIARFEAMAEALYANKAHEIPEQLQSTIDRLCTNLNEWQMLDPRTRSNEQSTVTNLLQVYMGFAAHDFFGGRDKQVVRVDDVIESGKILVVTVSALRTPQLASMIGRWMKSRFFAKLHGRELDYGTPGRLAGLILDEYPLVATGGEHRFSDLTHLQAMRAVRGFTIAATQGFEALIRRLGASETRALLAQFDQHFFFQSKEAAVAGLTESLWGRLPKWQAMPRKPAEEPPLTFPGDHAPRPTSVPYSVEWKPRVGIAELAALQTGEAWVWAPGTQAKAHPHWLVPLHESCGKTPEPGIEQAVAWENKLRALLDKQAYEEPLDPPEDSCLKEWGDFFPSELKGTKHYG